MSTNSGIQRQKGGRRVLFENLYVRFSSQRKRHCKQQQPQQNRQTQQQQQEQQQQQQQKQEQQQQQQCFVSGCSFVGSSNKNHNHLHSTSSMPIPSSILCRETELEYGTCSSLATSLSCCSLSVTKKKKRQALNLAVSFDEAETPQILPCHNEEGFDPYCVWYTDQDIEEFKKNQMAIACQLVQMERYRSALQDCFMACRQITFETTASVLSQEEEDHLVQALVQAQESVGLDLVCLGKQLVGAQRTKLLQRVCAEQEHLRQQRQQHLHEQSHLQALLSSTTMTTTPTTSVLERQDPTMERLKMVSQNLSRPSRLFARHLAQAHADALKRFEEQEQQKQRQQQPLWQRKEALFSKHR